MCRRWWRINGVGVVCYPPSSAVPLLVADSGGWAGVDRSVIFRLRRVVNVSPNREVRVLLRRCLTSVFGEVREVSPMVEVMWD